MGIYQELIDFDEVYANQINRTPTLVDYQALETHPLFQRGNKAKRDLSAYNQPQSQGENRLLLNVLNDMSSEDKEAINRSIYTRYSNESIIESIPTCECREGGLRGRFRVGVICPNCGTEVRNRYEDDIQSVIWMKAPKGIRALINPVAWAILSKRFMAEGRFDTLRWLCDTNYSAPNSKPNSVVAIEQVLKSLKIPRGLNSFYDHFDTIMEVLFDSRALSIGRVGRRDETRDFINMYRKSIFCQYLPLPNKVLMVLEKTNFGTYVDRNITDALDALWLMTGIDSEINPLKLYQKENRTIKAICLMQKYYSDLIKKIYMKKEGLFREHIYATRATYSFRCVISSLTKAHRHDEIHVPWGVGTTVLRYHIINKLWKRGWVPKDIVQLLKEYELKYHPTLAELFEEIINDHKDYGGIPVIAVRNPSLKRGSMQRLMITHVKSDPSDVTVGLSILIVRPFNAFNEVGVVKPVELREVP